MQSLRLGWASCPAEGSRRWLEPAGSEGSQVRLLNPWTCSRSSPAAGVRICLSHGQFSFCSRAPLFFFSFLEGPPRTASKTITSEWHTSVCQPLAKLRFWLQGARSSLQGVSARLSSAHTPASLSTHSCFCWSLCFFFLLSLPPWVLQLLSGSDRPENLSEWRRQNKPSFTCERSFGPATAAQETLRLTKRLEWGSPPSQDVLCRQDASHPAFLSLPHQIEGSARRVAFPNKGQARRDFQVLFRFSFLLQQQDNCFLDS